jgi:hypothetical protein
MFLNQTFLEQSPQIEINFRKIVEKQTCSGYDSYGSSILPFLDIPQKNSLYKSPLNICPIKSIITTDTEMLVLAIQYIHKYDILRSNLLRTSLVVLFTLN